MRVVTLHAPADAPRLQRFLERCSDYYELHEGCATPNDAGEYELTVVPPGRSVDDLHVAAVEDDDGTLHAVLQLLARFPKPDNWWIALLLVAPELRGRGTGMRLLQHALDLARADGATAMHLGVSLSNPRGRAFWERAGFTATGETFTVTARSGHVDRGEFMVLALHSSPA